MFFLILFLVSSCFELSNEVQWKCNDPVNDICSSDEVLTRLEDDHVRNENYRLLTLSQSLAIERNLSSKYPVPIIQLKDDTVYQICKAVLSRTTRALESESRLRSPEFEIFAGVGVGVRSRFFYPTPDSRRNFKKM